MQALRAGYRNLKKTLRYHKRYLQVMGIYAPATGPHQRDAIPAQNGLDQPVINIEISTKSLFQIIYNIFADTAVNCCPPTITITTTTTTPSSISKAW